jgi:hypothetical protein
MTDVCAICHEDLSDNLYNLPECSHTYHVNCIMHWFRTDHNTCPLCQNQGINYTQAWDIVGEQNYSERTAWQGYYKKACAHTRKKNADKEIVKRVKAIKKAEETNKKVRKRFQEWKKETPTALTNADVYKEYGKLRRGRWRHSRLAFRKKATTGYVFFHKFMKNNIIIAEKVQITHD